MDRATEQRSKMTGLVPTRNKILSQGDLEDFKTDILQEVRRIKAVSITLQLPYVAIKAD